MSSYGKLYLIPVPITDENGLDHIPEQTIETSLGLRYFIAENPKTARKHLKLFSYKNIEQAQISELNLHTDPALLGNLLQPLLDGENVGLMSEAGAPGIADPGADLIALAHLKGIEVLPLSGPSAVMLAIMASGFNGQNFAFTGYLPKDKEALKKKIKELEIYASRYKQAQFFIETPYRNKALFDLLLITLSPSTKLFLGIALLSEHSYAKSQTVTAWKKGSIPEMNKIPVVFGIY